MRVGQNWCGVLWSRNRGLKRRHLDELMQRLVREVPLPARIVMEMLQFYFDQFPDVRAGSFQQDVSPGEM
jgi:hypothetical protein